MFDPHAPIRHHLPLQIASDTFLIRQLQGEGQGPVSVYINSMVIRGKEPIIVDTGTPANRENWLRDVFSLVEPKDVRWIFLSHDDQDHTGNLREVLEACSNATLVTSWFAVDRLESIIHLPRERMRWVNDGDAFDAGDRILLAVRPPIFDSPTTRGLFDTRTGVYWAADAFAAPIVHPVDHADELDHAAWREGIVHFHRVLSPWLSLVDPDRYKTRLDVVRALGAKIVASGHSPIVTGRRIHEALELMATLPGQPEAELPTQGDLERMRAPARAAA